MHVCFYMLTFKHSRQMIWNEYSLMHWADWRLRGSDDRFGQEEGVIPLGSEWPNAGNPVLHLNLVAKRFPAYQGYRPEDELDAHHWMHRRFYLQG